MSCAIALAACSRADGEEEPRCSRHAECTSDVCDVYAETPAGAGACVDESAVIYVDNRNGLACPSGDGTRAYPLCAVDDALPLVHGDQHVLRLMASTASYGQLRLSDVEVTLFGPDDGGQALFTSEEDVTSIRITGASTVTLDGVAVRSGGRGVRCESESGEASLALRRSSLLRADSSSVSASGCELTVGRSLITGGLRGVQLSGAARYRITNSMITGHGGEPLIFGDDTTGTFALNTVAGNDGPVRCGDSARRLEDSIIAHPADGTSHFRGSCVLERVVVGASDTVPSPGAIRLDPVFVAAGAGDYHLARSPANGACCIDKAARRPDVPVDYDGDTRPIGPGFDIGADEVR